MFHARKWGLKRLAANLLLIPVIGGWSVGTATAQFGSGPSPLTGAPSAGMPANRGSAPAQMSGNPAEAKAILKQGREALAAGKFDMAQDLARRADNATTKWGLFGDTPRALLEDIQKAVAKNQKAQSAQMMKEAKSLLAKPAQGAERAASLDRAMQLTQQAERLHGPYSAWDLGERPEKLMKEIQAARAKLGNVPTGGPQFPATTASRTPGQTGPGAAPPRASDPRKTTALQMMTEARKLADQGQFAAARAKLTEADRIGAMFSPNEPNPGFAIQELNQRGAAAIDRLVAEAKARTVQKDFVKAEAALGGASEIAATLGLFPRPVEEARAQLRAATEGKFGGTGNPGVVASGGPEYLVPGAPISPIGPGPMGPLGPMSPTSPVGPGNTGIATTGGMTGTKPVAPIGGGATARQLLDQAAYEFTAGQFDTAERLALQAHNMGMQKEASELLNSLDAEKLKLKQLTAARSFDAALEAMKNKDYNHALGVLVLIDPKLLPADMKGRHGELVLECRGALDRLGVATSGMGVATAGGMQELPGMPGSSQPGTARVGDSTKPADPNSVAAQQDALKRVQVQKLRADGLKAQETALAAFGRGETELAMQILIDYANRLRAAGLEPAAVAMLMTPIESRLNTFRVMLGHTQSVARLNKETRDAKELISGRALADEQRRAEVQILVKKYHALAQKGDYAGAEKLAMQAKQLDPDDPALGALAHMAKVNDRVRRAEELKDKKERMVLRGLNDAEEPGAYVSIDDPIAFNLERSGRARMRGSLDDLYKRSRSPAEYEIELKLDKPISFEISQTPLEQAIDHLSETCKLPISLDTAAIEAEGINLAKPITEKLRDQVATRHVLTLVLDKAGLSYVVENDVIRVTTAKKAKGRLFTKVFSVADLVTPIPNFALPDYANMEKMLQANAINRGSAHISGLSGTTPYMPSSGINGGQNVSQQLPGQFATTPGVSGGVNFGAGGQLQTNQFPDRGGPLAASASLAGERNTKEAQLIRLITGMVRPYSWDGMGGPGRIEYYDIGSALVVNQVADVIQEVADLLEALRRLQDLAVAVEIRIVSLSEAWYERLGVDFSMNIKTHTTGFEPALTQIDPNTGLGGVFRPTPFINDNNFKGVTFGLTPAGTPTGDLDVPIRPNTFNRAIPVFGGYPNTPGDNGGVAFGLGFLNDIQVFLFMEAAQGDRRINVMQAPKITLFNGQTATLSANDVEFFVASLTVISVNGQIVFIPQNTPLPVGVNITVQAVVSADRRFVRMNLPVNMTALASTSVPLFPVTTFVTPVFEGGSQGVPIPFTQFLQQPAFTSLNIQTTVVCPDGGTVLLGGLKTLSEGRNEFGPPFLSKIPYLNRLFKNVGIGRETRHVMLMVTPRIIINSEEEIFQTEGRPPFGGGGP